jgi:DNA-binding transcriptional LysR family regulator
MYHDLQINRLRALVRVVDLGGFRKAAEALHVTQPAVSQQIRQLSTFIKAPVFVSTGRELQLSAQGEELLGYARRIVALNDEAVGRFMTSPGNERVSIGVTDQLAESLPEILRLLSAKMPGAQVCVRTGLSESLEEQVTAGRLNLALLLQSERQQAAAARRVLGDIRMDWFGRPTYREGTAVPLTLFTEPCTLRGHIMQALDDSAVPWRVAYEGDQLVGLRAAAKAGLGYACLVANGDELWGLPKAASPSLPSPPGPIPVTMALSGSMAGAEFVPIAERAFKHALRDYPFAR